MTILKIATVLALTLMTVTTIDASARPHRHRVVRHHRVHHTTHRHVRVIHHR